MKELILSRTDRIGDVILTTATFAPLRRKFPEARIRILVRPELTDLISSNRFGIEPVACPSGKSAKGFHLARYQQWRTYFRSDRANGIVFFHPDDDLQFAAAVAGIQDRIGYRFQWGRLALNHPVHYDRHLGKKHEAHCNFDLLESLGCTVPSDLKPEISIPQNSPLPDDLVEHKFIVFHPDAFGSKPRWPAHHYAALAEKLFSEYALRIVLIGSEQDQEIIGAIEGSTLSKTNWIDRRGQDDLVATAGILAKAALVVSRDSGPAHLAAAVGAPLICLMGQCNPKHSPTRWAPIGDQVETIIRDLPPRKKEKREKRWKRCFEAITPDEVFVAAKRLLKQ